MHGYKNDSGNEHYQSMFHPSLSQFEEPRYSLAVYRHVEGHQSVFYLELAASCTSRHCARQQEQQWELSVPQPIVRDRILLGASRCQLKTWTNFTGTSICHAIRRNKLPRAIDHD